MSLACIEKIELGIFKRCGKCGEDLPVVDFYANKTTSTGLSWACKACAREPSRKRQRKYRQKHRDKLLAQRREQYRENPGPVGERMRRYYQQHKEKLKARSRAYHLKHRDEILARQREATKTPEARAYKRAREQKRRMRKAGLVSSYTREQWLATLVWFDNCCAYCGVFGEPLQQEHVIPLLKGGHYVVGNIVPACGRCNASKRDLTLTAWVTGRGSCFVVPGLIERVGAYIERALADG